MSQVRSVICVLLLLSGVFNVAWGYKFFSPDVAGLSGHYVNAVLSDKYGFLWVAADDGVKRYDGYKVAKYAITDTTGNTDDDVVKIEEDGAGDMWITTYNDIYGYDREHDCITTSAADSVLARLGIKANVDFVDVDSDKGLWCSVGSDTLYYYSFRDKLLRSMAIRARPLCADCRDGHGVVLFGNGDLTEVNWHTGRLRAVARLEMFPYSEFRMYIDTSLRLWVIDRMSPGGLCLSVAGGKPCGIDFGDSLVKAIAEDDSGNVWLGTNNDGIRIISTDGTHVEITADEHSAYGLRSNHINYLYNDGRGLMWVGTSKRGLAYAVRDEASVEICRTTMQEDICCFQEDDGGRLWIGYDGKGIAVYDSTGVLVHTFDVGSGGLPSDLVVGVYREVDTGRLWFGSYGGGVFSVDDSGGVARLAHDVLAYTRHIAKDNQGNLWAGTFTAGLHCCNLGNDSIVASFGKHNSCLKTDCVTGLCFDSKTGLLYVATSTGLYVVDTSTMTVACAADEEGLLSDMPITCLLLDSRGLLWVGTNSGMAVYDKSFGLHCRLTDADGLSDNRILALVEDDNRNVWATTGRGISNIITDSISGGEYTFNAFPYYEEDGLGEISFNKYSIYCTNRGDILAGGSGKYVKINPDRMDASNFGKVVFTGLQVDHKEVAVGDGLHVIDRPISICEKITVDAGANVQLEVSAMNYRYNHRLRYVYRLDDGARWVATSGNRVVLDNLEPGLHILEVKVAGSSSSSKLAINVSKPFWLSAPAMMLYLIIPWIVAIFVYRWWRKRKTCQPQVADTLQPVSHETVNDANKEFVDKATALVVANIDNADFSVEDFGVQMGMSRSNLYKKMMQATGKSPIDFMREIRLKRGMELLRDSSLGISQVAYSIGLSPKQFSKLFKEAYGCLPSQYRKPGK